MPPQDSNLKAEVLSTDKNLDRSGSDQRSNYIVLASAALALFSVVLLAYVIIWQNDNPKLLQIRAGRYSSGGKLEPQVQQVTYKIWTPNEHTVSDLEDADVEDIPSYYRFSETQKLLWVSGLKKLGVGGYSYYEVWGIGTNPLKRGLQWEITAPRGGELTRRALLRLYGEVFSRSTGIYLEEMTLEDRR